jgi:predicted component of type VI protein secretion system
VLGDTTLIGRGTDCDYILDDTQASRSHALIEKGEDGYTLTDQDSSNGTFVDEERLFGPVLLSEGDTIRIGQTTFILEQLDESGEEEAQGAAPEPEAERSPEPAPPVEAVTPVEPPPAFEAPKPAEPVQAQAPAGKFCPSCGAALEPGIAFCGECGHQLAAAPAAWQPPEAAAGAWDAINSLEPQPINPRKLYFSRRGLLIGGGVILGLLLSAICCAVVVSYVVEEIL